MQRATLIGLAIWVIAGSAWTGGEPWKSKPYQQWDEKDVATVLQLSPWAKINLPIVGAWHPSGAEAADTSTLGVAGSGTDTSNRSNGAGTNQPGGTEKQAAAGTQMYDVFWWSSRTIREASARRAVLNGATTQEAADKMVSAPVNAYQILVNPLIWRSSSSAEKRRSNKRRSFKCISPNRNLVRQKLSFKRIQPEGSWELFSVLKRVVRTENRRFRQTRKRSISTCELGTHG
jgi:hypothetical protein